jgi:RNA polymerase sigma-70 factor (ECF subfamily)
MNEMRDTGAETPDESSLLARLRQEPARWLPTVLERYERPLLRHAGSVLADPAAAQDVVQECFLKLLSNGQPVENLSAWLHRVTHNLAVDHLRGEARRQRLHLAAAQARPSAAPTAEEALGARDAQGLVERELQALTPNERAVLHLKLKAGQSYREISAITGLSVTNVGYLIHQAVKKVASRLKAQGVVRGKA